jgi:putative SOS response-associated peptidase YedK
MCARASLSKKQLREVAEELEAMLAEGDEALYRPRYNIAPSDSSWVLQTVGDDRVLAPAVWGYVARDRPLINVRGEQVASGAGFRDAFANRRCLVVTDGFYEWDSSKRPTWFHRQDDRLALLGGLFQETDRGRRFTVLTTKPNNLVATIHDRMPVIVSSDAIDRWLTGSSVEATSLVAPAADDVLVATAVSTYVNSVKHDDPACLSPRAPDRQRSLF